jgi:serine/threonine-protein kinase ULK/ATG1
VRVLTPCVQTTGALVAVKSVNLAKLNGKLKDNLYCEIEILKGLHHPHIVALIDCRESSTHIHLVMEYCELGDLSYFIKKRDKLGDNPALRDMVRKYPNPAHGGLSEVVVRHFLKQLASAMRFLRDRDFIHRDVKPQNLLLLPSPQYMADSKDLPLVMTASGEALVPMVGLTSLPLLKLADFGFARSLPSTSLAETLCGSPLYMAPEILRYEKYDAKADLWSVGTVLFEMMMGKPPFRAANHVELIRRIEQTDDQIKYPREVIMSAEIKALMKSLLKRKPVERLPFEDFFRNSVVVDPIPGLVGDDRPREIVPSTSDESPGALQPSPGRRQASASVRDAAPAMGRTQSSSPRDRPAASTPNRYSVDHARQIGETPPQSASQPPSSPRDRARPPAVPSATAPDAVAVQGGRQPSRTFTDPVPRSDQRRLPLRQVSGDGRNKAKPVEDVQITDEIAEAEIAVREARDYVVVEKRVVEVNSLADEMAASPSLGAQNPPSPRSGQQARRDTTQGHPTSLTGALPASPSRAGQAARGARPDAALQRQPSQGSLGSSPSATSAIAKALHGASVRVFGVGWSPHLLGKGASPPQLYNPFPVYPTPQGTIGLGLISDGRPSGPIDEDQKTVNAIEEAATRSDVVYGFAEVKYKQLVPITPSMDHGLGGHAPDRTGDPISDDDGLTVEATVALSEEALVLYVKALSLLAKSMDIARAWWSQKSRGEVLGGGHAQRSDSAARIAAGNRINSAVQWVRNRFNEVLEKAEIVRLKLIAAQKQLPKDHPGHPNNHASASKLAGATAGDGVVLNSCVSAEKLMYDRALDMSRAAAINEIANEDLPGCEISYITAIRMLEAVLEDEDEARPKRKRSSSLRDAKDGEGGETVNGLSGDDRQAVLKGISCSLQYPSVVIRLFTHFSLLESNAV